MDDYNLPINHVSDETDKRIEMAKKSMSALHSISPQGYRNLAIRDDMNEATSVSREVRPNLKEE